MEINWYGLSCFRIVEKKYATVVCDPYRKKVGLELPKVKADFVTVSHDASGHNNAKAVNGATRVLTGPGEYEIGDVFVTAIPTYGNDRRNIMYLFDYNGLTVAHLGDIQTIPTQAQIEALEQVNILMVPVGGGSSLTAAQAAELISMLEPNIVIPMHYKMDGLKFELNELGRFLKEMGAAETEPETKLRISSSNLPEQSEVVVLAPKV